MVGKPFKNSLGDQTGSGSCAMVVFNISGVDHLGPATRVSFLMSIGTIVSTSDLCVIMQGCFHVFI